MTKFTFKGRLFEEKSEGETIAEHTVFSIEGWSDLGEWFLSTIENAIKELAGTFAEDIYSSKDFLVRIFLVPSKEVEGGRANAIMIEDFVLPQTVTVVFPHIEVPVDSLVDILNTCKM